MDRVIAETKWLKFKERFFVRKDGNIDSWTFVERHGNTQAVIIFAETKDKVIFTKQFRHPFNDYIYDCPAGMIDKNETPGEAALRELREETGYTGTIKNVSPPLSSSAGLTNEVIYIARVKCDNEPGNQELEVTEDIEVITLDKKDIFNFIKGNRGIIDSKLYNFLYSFI